MKTVRSVLAVVVCVAIAGAVLAAEGQPGGRRGQGGPGRGFGDPSARIDFMVRGLDLTDAQKGKIEDIKKEFGPKLKAAQEKQDSILTDEQKKVRAEEFRKAREAGQGFQNLRETIEKALKLTDEQKKKMDEARKAAQELNDALREKIWSVLTPEQKKKMEEARPQRGNSGGGRGNRGQ